MSYSRRRFIGGTVAGLASIACTRPRTALAMLAQSRSADLVVLNARVYTVDPALPTAAAFAVRAGRFVAIGSSADIRGYVGAKTQVIDASGMTVVPGFIDTHNHAPGNTLLYEVLVGDPYEVEFVTIQSIIDKLKAKARQTPPDTWVEGFFFDDTKLKDQRQLSLHDLDEVSRDQPVAVHHRGGHTSYYNSRALQMAGITRSTPDVPGGTYDKDPDGELNGRVTDAACDVIDRVGKRPVYSADEAMRRDRAGLAYISRQFVRAGLTGVCHESGNLHALADLRQSGELLHRVSYEADGAQLEAMIAGGMPTGLGDEWLRLGATCEHIVDGSFSERTMALSVPYPGSRSGYQGNLIETQDALDAWCERIHRAGIQLNCHANGDVAIDHVLTAYERALQRMPQTNARPRITHCTLINDGLVQRIKALDAVPSPFTSYAFYNPDKFHFYGQELMRHCMAYRTFLDAGIHVAAGSDFDPGPFAPLMGIQGMVTRTGWNGETWGANQRISVDEALRVYTINGAYATREEDIKGSISIGKLADFVVLAEDPHSVEPGRIKDVRIVRTVVGGKSVYSNA